MTLPSSPNSISLSQIATEFSGNPSLGSTDFPLELGEYYGQDNAPTTGAISFSNFHGGDGVPSSGLQYHYDAQISETTTAAGGVEDISINDRTATLTNGAAYNSGNLGKIVFDGVDDYVRVTGYKGVTGKTARTSIVFVKLDAATPAAQARALSWGSSSNGAKWGMEFTTAGKFLLGVGGASRESNFQFTLNQWGMFAATIPTGVTGTAGVGQQAYTTAGTNSFTVPAGVYSISAVCVGGGGGGGARDQSDEPGGGGGGGALAYRTFSVTPGEVLTVNVGSGGGGGSGGNNGGSGGTTSITRSGTPLVSAAGGSGGGGDSGGGGSGGSARTGDGGGNGGNGGGTNDGNNGGGGGGAGGYSGNGGNGAAGGTTNTSGTAGQGGGGGGSGTASDSTSGGGGGVGILGSGANGTAGPAGGNGGGGSGGAAGNNTGGAYGGGGGGGATNAGTSSGRAGGVGAARLIWGPGRSYPSTSVADATPVTGSNTSGFLTDVTLYYNATKLTDYTTGSQEVNTASSADVTWGASLADATLGPIDGEISKILVYNRELTHAEITQIYNAKAVALGLAQLSATTEGSGSPIDPTYSISASTTSLNEGSSVTFTVTTTNIPSGTTLYWSLNAVTGTISNADFTGGASSGSFTITSGSGSVALTLANDATTEGSESFQFQIRTVSTTGTVVATGPTVTIGDTSTGASTERGVFGGGDTGAFTSNMQYINIASTGNAQNWGSLTVARYLLAACSSSTRGVWGGGWDGGPTSGMDYKDLSSNGTATSFGSLTQSKDSFGACSNATIGMFNGGDTGSFTDRIDRITIATTGNAADHGNLQQAKAYTSSCSSTTRAITFGGLNSGNTTLTQIDYHTISTTPANAINFGSLITARESTGACSSSTRGLCFIGENSSGNSLSSIEYITIATTGNAQSFGTSNYTNSYPAAVAGSTRGVHAGGMTDIAGSNLVNNISYVTIATTGNSVSFGTLVSARGAMAGCSSNHGGL